MVPALDETRLERIEHAMKQAGLSVGQAARLLDWSKRELEKVMAAIANDGMATFKLWKVVDLAQVLQVDPRWLLRGLPSPAAESMIAGLQKLRAEEKGNFHRMKQADFNDLLLRFRSWPQPELAEAEMQTCRYCGCTPMIACAEGCEWVDQASTICSACLVPEEPWGSGP